MVQTAIEWSQEAVARCVATVVKSRRAVRAFRPEPLRRELIQEILAEAATAPSGANIQPWRVYVVSGAVKDELANVLVAASRAGTAPAPAHFPEPLPDVFRARLLTSARATTLRSESIATTPRRARARPSGTSHFLARRWVSSSASTAD